MKRKLQIAAGSLSLLAGLVLFAYFGTRERPAGAAATPETLEQAFRNDLATFAGLGLLFAGCVILLLGAAAHWNRRNAEPADGSGGRRS